MVPDYYMMLGVDPTADRGTIEGALARQQPAWSAGTRNPKTKHTHQSYLDQIPALRQALLSDPTARAAYDAEREAVRRAGRDASLDQLQKKIRLRAAKGGLTVSDRKLLREEAVKIGLKAEDADRLAEPIPPRPEAPADLAEVEEPSGDVLDPVMRRQTKVALDHLRKSDLYDALGLDRDAPAREVAARADAERQRWMKKTQVTAEKTAWLEVVTLAQSHLTTPASRARYDRTLDLERDDMLLGAVEFAIKGLRQLDPGTRLALQDEAEALGIAPDRADRLIARVCKAQGVGRDGASGPPALGTSVLGPPRLLRCRSCGGITNHAHVERNAARADCKHCGASLHWACPVCQRTHWVDEPRCACGFRVELREPVVRHFEAAQHSFRSRDYPSALAHLKRVQELAANHAGARKGIERVRERVAEIDLARAAFEVARGGGKLVAAKAAAVAWGKLVDPATADWRAAFTEVTRALRDAQTLVARARPLERTNPGKARALYRKALTLSADLPEPAVGLKRCPPDPPTGLTAAFEGEHVRLRWSPPAPDGLGPVSYTILRKLDAAFAHAADGVPLGDAIAPEFDDFSAVAGTSAAYAVVSRRGDAEPVGAVTVGPIFLLGEVSDLRVDTRNREIDLSWRTPPGAVEVRVVRKRGGMPTGPGDGDRVEATNGHAHDRGLETDRVYHYGLYAVYRTPDGRATAARGVFVSAQPHTPVHPMDAPLITPEGDGHVTLRWVEPARGLVKIVRTTHPLAYAPGTRLAPAQVAAIGGDWVEVDAPDHARDTPPPVGLCYYTPLTSWAGSATVGHASAYSRVADPSELRAQRAGGTVVHLRWRWGPQGDQTLVVYRAGSPPTGPDDPNARVETASEGEYARLGRYTLTLPAGEAGPWHIAVYAIANVDGQAATSPGLEPTSRTVIVGPHPEVTVSYTFRKGSITGRKPSVTFRTEPSGSKIPPTVLVTHPRAVPVSPDDGERAASFPASADGASFPLPNGVDVRKAFARIFADPAAEPDGLPPILFRHPEADSTRV